MQITGPLPAEILSQQVWVRVQKPVFLTSSQVMVMLLICVTLAQGDSMGPRDD